MAIPAGVTDDTLLTRAREGDSEAFEALYHRHRRTATRAAHRYSPRNPLAEDAVQEAFLRILRSTQAGRGPSEGAAFGGYLATTVRHVLAGWARAERTVATDDDDALAVLVAQDRGAVEGVGLPEGRLRWHLLVKAFRSLPTRWQEALWSGEVEGVPVADLAARWNMTPNSAAALTYRARDGLRTAWLEAHLNAGQFPEACRPFALDLPRHARDKLSTLRAAEVEEHVAGCDHCRAVLAELDGAARGFGVVLVPVATWAGWTATGAGPLVLGKVAGAFVAQHGKRVVVAGSAIGAAAVIAIGGLATQPTGTGVPGSSGTPSVVPSDRGAEPTAATTATPDASDEASPDEPDEDPTDPASPSPIPSTDAGDDQGDTGDQGSGVTGAPDTDLDAPALIDTPDVDAPDPAPTTAPAPEPDDGDGGGGTDPDPDPDPPPDPDPDPGGGGGDEGGEDDGPVAPAAPSVELSRTGLLGLTLVVQGRGVPGAVVDVVPTLGLLPSSTTVAADGTWRSQLGLVSSLTGTLTVSVTQTVDGVTSPATSRSLNL